METKQLYMLVEIPKGSNNKYEYDWRNKQLFVDRTIFFSFPINYGFLCNQKSDPLSLSEDGDDMDVICLGDPVVPICLIPIKIIGALQMTDNGEKDNKLLAVNINDSRWGHLDDIQECWDFIEPTLAEISFFFDNYKDWKKDSPKKIILEGWVGNKEANKILEESLLRYQKYEKQIEKGIDKKTLISLIKQEEQK